MIALFGLFAEVERDLISAAAIHTVREHLAKPFDRLALPCGHLVRMHLLLRGNLLQRPVAPQRFRSSQPALIEVLSDESKRLHEEMRAGSSTLDLQRRAAPRQPRPGAAAHVSAEAFSGRPVSL